MIWYTTWDSTVSFYLLYYFLFKFSEEEIYEDADEEGEYNVIDEAPRIDECE